MQKNEYEQVKRTIKKIIICLFLCLFLAACENFSNELPFISDRGKGNQATFTFENTKEGNIDIVETSTSPILHQNTDFLYKDKEITLRAIPYDPSFSGMQICNIVNLDNIAKSDVSNSDIEIIISRGSQVFFILNPINGAMSYFPGIEKIDIGYCLENIQKFSDKAVPEFISGKPICVITNERRIAIIQVFTSFTHNYDDTYNVEFQLTEFSSQSPE